MPPFDVEALAERVARCCADAELAMAAAAAGRTVRRRIRLGRAGRPQAEMYRSASGGELDGP